MNVFVELLLLLYFTGIFHTSVQVELDAFLPILLVIVCPFQKWLMHVAKVNQNHKSVLKEGNAR